MSLQHSGVDARTWSRGLIGWPCHAVMNLANSLGQLIGMSSWLYGCNGCEHIQWSFWFILCKNAWNTKHEGRRASETWGSKSELFSTLKWLLMRPALLTQNSKWTGMDRLVCSKCVILSIPHKASLLSNTDLTALRCIKALNPAGWMRLYHCLVQTWSSGTCCTSWKTKDWLVDILGTHWLVAS